MSGKGGKEALPGTPGKGGASPGGSGGRGGWPGGGGGKFGGGGGSVIEGSAEDVPGMFDWLGFGVTELTEGIWKAEESWFPSRVS